MKPFKVTMDVTFYEFKIEFIRIKEDKYRTGETCVFEVSGLTGYPMDDQNWAYLCKAEFSVEEGFKLTSPHLLAWCPDVEDEVKKFITETFSFKNAIS